MTTVERPTSGQLRAVRWKPVDQVLRRYSTTSLLTLLDAALASPNCARFHDHLLLLWTRVLRGTAHPGIEADAQDLPRLVEAAMRAAPGRMTMTEAEPRDPRALVRFEVAGRRLLVHPGELDHPLIVLRQIRTTALAVDDQLAAIRGFTLTDVLELVLHYTDHVVQALAPAWPRPEGDQRADGFACGVLPAEVAAARALADLDPEVLAGRCREPERARRALAWLTADLHRMPLRYHPGTPLLGPVLAVRAYGRHRLVPVSAALDTLAAAAAGLTTDLPDAGAAQQLLHKLTVDRAAQLLGLTHAPVHPEPVEVIGSDSLRYDTAVVSGLPGGLPVRIEEARTILPPAGEGRGRLVVYGGPETLGPEVITDTAYLHVEELAEVLADAQGDPSLLALFVAELTAHPGVDAIACHEPLDAWKKWHRDGTLLLPGPYRPEVAVVPAAGHDMSWQRAADWARVDDVLAAAGLPTSLDWRFARLTEPDPGAAGPYADLLEPGDTSAGGGGMLVRVSTAPPLVVQAAPCPEPGTLLDAPSMAALADSIRSTLAPHPVLAAHTTLPDGAPLTIQITETPPSYEWAEPAGPAQGPGPEDGGSGAGERWPVHVCADADTARIGLVLDRVLIAGFTGDGRPGHQLLGQLLHHLTTTVRAGRSAPPGIGRLEFTTAWDAALPVLRLFTGPTTQPPATPAFGLPRSPHVHVRALRIVAGAVRDARIAAGTWHGPDAYRAGGPGDQLLHTLETLLDQQIRSHRPDLVPELARQLNAALAQRTRRRHEAVVNLALPWDENWDQETGRRQYEYATVTTALQLLLQHATAHPPNGNRPPDTLAVADLVALAELVLRCGITAVAAARRLHDLHLTIHPTGIVTLTADENHGGQGDDAPTQHDADVLIHLGFDADAHGRARDADFLARVRARGDTPADPVAPDALAPAGRRTTLPYSAPTLITGSPLHRADQLLHQHWGFGLAALRAVLSTAADWPTGPDGTATVTPAELTTEAAVWSQLPKAELAAAVDRLRLHPGNADTDRPHPYTEVERRARTMTHPLIEHDGRLLLLPWLLTTSAELYGSYLDNGRLPHPDLPAPVRDALRRHRRVLDQQLEIDIEDVARAAGLPHRARLLEKTAAQHGIHHLPGEIDLLIADPATARLWIIEAKNPEQGTAIHHLLQRIQRFGPYIDKLLAKTAVIRDNAAAAADLCGADSRLAWRAVPLIVTRTVETAAFLADPQVAYTTADHLAAILAAPGDPLPGWNGPGQPGAPVSR
ncbi:hypothetical protein MHW47_05205 [Streptomyces sp. OfavH-34-F]|uniref:hypothetical protein n=1 Tax=Streptomyces sp. OfavH-34-F TaxID=2917760 RepID=UPI001EF3C243|nr:hypothetical protein [Streptomyces sp. OfavH-34-F]MCG7523846.1 hypothetical protein [Streptomyces sp. OfavH-34-F]